LFASLPARCSFAIRVPVVGILLATVGLGLRQGFDRQGTAANGEGAASVAADGLLKHLGLLFVPAGVGIAQSYDLVIANGIAIAAALIGSTLLTLVATVVTFRLVARLIERRPSE